MEDIKSLEKKNENLKNIIRFIMSDTDVCDCCKKKGINLPDCKVRDDNEECLRRILKLWDAE